MKFSELITKLHSASQPHMLMYIDIRSDCELVDVNILASGQSDVQAGTLYFADAGQLTPDTVLPTNLLYYGTLPPELADRLTNSAMIDRGEFAVLFQTVKELLSYQQSDQQLYTQVLYMLCNGAELDRVLTKMTDVTGDLFVVIDSTGKLVAKTKNFYVDYPLWMRSIEQGYCSDILMEYIEDRRRKNEYSLSDKPFTLFCEHMQRYLLCTRIVGLVSLVVCVVCALGVRQAPVGYTPAGFAGSASSAETQLESYNVRRALKTRPIWHLIVCTAFFPTMYMIMFPRFSVYMTDAGFTLSAATLGVSIYFIANTLSRLFLGALCDKISYKHVYGICGVLCILSAICLIAAKSLFMFYLGYALLGLGFGATNSVYPVTINKSYGPVYAGGIYGVALFGYMIFCTLITPRISAALVASTGGYTASFIYGIVLSCVAVVSMYLIPKVDRKPLDAAEKQAESV